MDIVQCPIHAPFTMVVSGQSGCGKTTFVKSLLENINKLCQQKFEKIIYAFSVQKPMYEDISAIEGVEMTHGFPTDKISETNTTPTLVILDDMMLDADENTLVKLFTKLRHALYSTIFITQNFYFNSKHWRTVTRNAHYIVLFRNPRDMSMVHCLGRQMYPQCTKFLPDAFEQATERAYSYLFIDLKPYTAEDFRIREGIFPEEDKYRYVKKNKHK